MEKAKDYIARFYILAMFFVVPVYNAGTFIGITQRKVESFFFIAAITVIAYGAVVLFFDLKGKKDEKNEESGKGTGLSGLLKNLSALDKAMILFLAAAALSTCFSDYRKESIYGVPGFGTGLVAILVYVASYFLISRYLKPERWLFYLIAVSSAIPVAVALMNELGLDPMGFYMENENPAKHLYISTIGNYGWYSAYLVMIIALVMYLVFTEKKPVIKIALAIYLILCLISVFVSGNSISKALSVLSFVMVVLGKKVKVSDETKKKISIIFPVFAICICIAYGGIIMMAGSGSMDSFGNGRGYIWRLSMELFESASPIHKLVGVGPNCYMYAINDYLETDQALLANFTEHFNKLALTTAHSEYFDYLINMGLVGLFVYLSALILFFKGFFSGSSSGMAKEISMLCCVIYLIYMLLNFSIVCATPYFFIFMGITANRPRVSSTCF